MHDLFHVVQCVWFELNVTSYIEFFNTCYVSHCYKIIIHVFFFFVITAVRLWSWCKTKKKIDRKLPLLWHSKDTFKKRYLSLFMCRSLMDESGCLSALSGKGTNIYTKAQRNEYVLIFWAWTSTCSSHSNENLQCSWSPNCSFPRGSCVGESFPQVW